MDFSAVLPLLFWTPVSRRKMDSVLSWVSSHGDAVSFCVAWA